MHAERLTASKLRKLVAAVSVEEADDFPTRICAAIEQVAESVAEGSPLPAVAEVARALNVSEQTVRNGYLMAVEAGIAKSKRGRNGGYWLAEGIETLRAEVDGFLDRAREIADDETIVRMLREQFPALETAYTARSRRDVEQYFGRFASGLHDVAERHDQYLDS